MKKLFISCPMKGRTEEAIKDSMARMHKIAELTFGEELEPIDSYISGDAPEDNKKAMWYLGESIQMMAEADYFVGISEFGYDGCEMERFVAHKYDIPSLLLSIHHLMPDIEYPVVSALSLGYGGVGGLGCW